MWLSETLVRWRNSLSREGIPWGEYRWGHLLLSLPFVAVMMLAYRLLRLTVRLEPPKIEAPIPPNAIIILFHPDWPIFPLDSNFWREHATGLAWVGIHNFLSYASSMFCYLWNFRAIRYDRRTGIRPMELIRDYLKNNPSGLFALRTDSGGPYLVVRHSAVTMAVETGRPIVAVRQRGSKMIQLSNLHVIPLPFTRIRTFVSAPIPAERLAALPIDQARDLVQKTIDSLLKG